MSLESNVYVILTACCNDFNLYSPCKCSTNISSSSNVEQNYNLSYTEPFKRANKMSKNQFRFENYLVCLQNQRSQRTVDIRMQSQCPQISSNNIQKNYYQVFWTNAIFLIVESTLYLFLLLTVVGVMKLSAPNAPSTFFSLIASQQTNKNTYKH